MWSAFSLGLKAGLTAFLSYFMVNEIFKPSPTSYIYIQGPETACFSNATTGAKSGECVPLLQCSRYFNQLHILNQSSCRLGNNTMGFCCPLPVPPVPNPHLYLLSNGTYWVVPLIIPPLTTDKINLACEKAIEKFKWRQEEEKILVRNNNLAQPGTPVFYHAKLFQTSKRIYLLGLDSTLVLLASIEIVEAYGLNREQSLTVFTNYKVINTIIKDTCPPTHTCAHPKEMYRSIDGTCNNLLYPNWGRTGATMNRLLIQDYKDGLQVPRLSVAGTVLPSARFISSIVNIDESRNNTNFTLTLMQWGQFLDHDITHTPITKGPALTDISCCKDGIFRPKTDQHPECYPIPIPDNDPVFGSNKHSCMEFVRSMPAIRPNCSFGPREQMNQVTSYIDASMVYGSTIEDEISVRSFVKGQLKTNTQNGRNTLPLDPNNCDVYNQLQGLNCFKAGDFRVNENPQLAVLHSVWLRQHNKIVQQLATLNPSWDDQKLFQEGRRIVGAQIQHITFNEFLPIILGRQFVELYGLIPLRSDYFYGYRDDVDATIINAFSTAAFRFGHSLVPREIRTNSTAGNVVVSRNISSIFFNSSVLFPTGALESFINGLVAQPPEQTDRYFTNEITNKLFAFGLPFGLDLVAMNIQRGRDHGLPSYTKWRVHCGLKPAITFEDLIVDMDVMTVEALKRSYVSVEDIDLYVGGISEKNVNDSVLGPTFHCIIAKQFLRLKIGDRFYYENGPSAKYNSAVTSFTAAQLNEIRKTSLARILCDNSNIVRVQPLAFVAPISINAQILCTDRVKLPTVNLNPWKVTVT